MALTQIIGDGLDSAAISTVNSEGGAVTTSVVQGLAKCWANFNGQGTVAGRDSLNVSSLDDDGTGSYGVNMSSVFSSADHSSHATCNAIGNFSAVEINSVNSVGVNSLRCWNDDPQVVDPDLVFTTSHGDLA